MGKLDQLLSEIQQEIRDKKAELQAAQTQLNALQSAHSDLSDEVEKSHAKLADIRGQLAQSETELRKRRDEADSAASNILNAAHRTRAAAAKMVKEAEDQVDELIMVAQNQARDLEAGKAAAQKELQAIESQVNAARGELIRLKKSAADWSNS